MSSQWRPHIAPTTSTTEADGLRGIGATGITTRGRNMRGQLASEYREVRNSRRRGRIGVADTIGTTATVINTLHVPISAVVVRSVDFTFLGARFASAPFLFRLNICNI